MNYKLIAAEAILAFAGSNLAKKLAALYVISHLFGSDVAKSVASTDSVLSSEASAVVDGLNGSISAAVTASEGVSGVTKDAAISTAVATIEQQATALLEKAGADASVATLLVALEDATITTAVTNAVNSLASAS